MERIRGQKSDCITAYRLFNFIKLNKNKINKTHIYNDIIDGTLFYHFNILTFDMRFVLRYDKQTMLINRFYFDVVGFNMKKKKGKLFNSVSIVYPTHSIMKENKDIIEYINEMKDLIVYGKTKNGHIPKFQ